MIADKVAPNHFVQERIEAAFEASQVGQATFSQLAATGLARGHIRVNAIIPSRIRTNSGERTYRRKLSGSPPTSGCRNTSRPSWAAPPIRRRLPTSSSTASPTRATRSPAWWW